MTVFDSPAATALFLAAAVLTLVPALFERVRFLSYIGGLCWAAGTVLALVQGAELREIVVITLLLLALSAAGFCRRERK